MTACVTTSAPSQTLAIDGRVGRAVGPVTAAIEAAVNAVVNGAWSVTVTRTWSPVGDFVLGLPPSCSEHEVGQVATALVRNPLIGKISWRDSRIFLGVSDEAICSLLDETDWSHPFSPALPRHVALLFSNPNSNKPLHLGHFRQNAMGMALYRLFQAAGVPVTSASLHGDWGIHIAQAMVGQEQLDAGDRARLAGMKGDHAAGWSIARYYRLAQEDPTLEDRARELLRRLHSGDQGALERCHRVTSAASAGHAATYRTIGSEFGYEAHESRVIARAFDLVDNGCREGLFRRRDDDSVAADFTAKNMWDVTVVRGDGTTTCYPQHLAGWDRVFTDLEPDIVLVLIGPDLHPPARAWGAMAEGLGLEWAGRFFTFHHGLVRSSAGRLRSRYGQSLTIDAVLEDIVARDTKGSAPDEHVHERALGLLKYFFLRVPRTKDVTYVESALWDVAAPRFDRIAEAVAAARDRAESAPGLVPSDDGRTLSPPVRDLAFCLDDFALAARGSLVQLDPSSLVRHLDRLASAVLACTTAPDATRSVWRPAAAILDQSLALLNISLS